MTAVVLLTALGAPARAEEEAGSAKKERRMARESRRAAEDRGVVNEARRAARERRRATTSAGAPLSADTVGAELSPVPQIVAAPVALSLTLDGDLDLGGFVFKSGLPFLHNDGGAGFGNTALGLYALVSTTPGVPASYDGARNTALGQSALRDNTTGYSNTATGQSALRDNTTGYFNTATGQSALRHNTTGRWNTASGDRALQYNLTGIDNTASGSAALQYNTTGSYNTATGSYALSSNTDGYANTAAGTLSLGNNTTGYANTAIGLRALSDNTTGSGNTAIGSLALDDSVSGYNNTATGVFALSNSTSSYNTAVGYDTLYSTTTGSYNSALGYEALYDNATGSRNTAVGDRAGRNATTGSDNIFLGSGAVGVAGEANTIRIGGTVVGTGAGQQNRAFINGIYGVPVAGSNVVVTASGQLGTGSAVGGFDAITSGTNTAATMTVGSGASLDAAGSGTIAATTAATATTATSATALGADGTNCPAGQWSAGVDEAGNAQGCTTDGGIDHGFALGNTGVGSQALASNTTGNHNTASGYRALTSNTVGNKNTATGSYALEFTTGSYNTAVGYETLASNGSGTRNSALGHEALYYNTTGSRNTALGHRAGYYATTGGDNIFLGSGAVGVAGEANTIRIGGTVVGAGAGQQNRTFINGILGVPVAAGSFYVVVDPAGQLGSGPAVLPSSRRYKEEIRDMGEASGRVLELRPVTFRFKEEFERGDSYLQFGLIAEEVAEVLPELVVYDGEGRPERVDYRKLSPLLLNELQKLSAALREKQRVNRVQARTIEKLEATSAQLAELRARVADLEASAQASPRIAVTQVRARPSPPPGTK